ANRKKDAGLTRLDFERHYPGKSGVRRLAMKTISPACQIVAGLFCAAAMAISAPMVRAQELTAPDFKSSRPTPRTADGHPDLSGYWKGTRETHPVGNIGKDLPGFKLPL